MGLIVLTFKGLNRTLDQLPAGSPAWQTASLLRSSMVGYLTCAWFLSRTYGPALFFLLALCIGAWLCAVRSMPTHQVPAPLLSIDWRRDTLRLMGLTIFGVMLFVRSH